MSRSLYHPIGQVDLERFRKAVDDWVIAYAELYAMKRA